LIWFELWEICVEAGYVMYKKDSWIRRTLQFLIPFLNFSHPHRLNDFSCR
jgi:hypothetical protein